MRAFISKVAAGSMIAVAAIAISACTPKTETTTTDNTMVTDLNSTDAVLSEACPISGGGVSSHQKLKPEIKTY